MIGLIIIGDEILSGRRQDKHLSKAIELLGERGMALSWARYVGDDPELHAMARQLDPTGARILFAPVQALPMASSALRARLVDGEACEAELPETVRTVIRREKLYQKKEGSGK